MAGPASSARRHRGRHRLLRPPPLLERGDELVGQAEPGNGELLVVPLEPLQPLVGVASVGALLVILVVAPELEPLEGVLAEHGVGEATAPAAAHPRRRSAQRC